MENKETNNSLGVTIISAAIVVVLIVVIAVGFFLPKQAETIQGEAETRDYRVSSKVPSRVLELRVGEGDMVRKGDTLAIMESPEVQAKLSQANAARSAAEAIQTKARNGARAEEVQMAHEMWQKAKAGLEIAEKSYQRVERLFQNGVLTEQKRDEAKAQYEAMVATEKAARSQYEMAQKGARSEDKAAAAAQVRRAEGAIEEVNCYVNETVLIATADGQVTEIFPEVGELVGTGAPIMNIACVDDVWFTFNVREDKLPSLAVGQEREVYVPALDQTVKVKISRMKNVGNFAAWKATKALDDMDLKVFEVKAVPTAPVKGVCSGMSAVLNE